ncbi:MAG: peptide/nickel transport system ATP-binding protein [Clostridiales bacterium]|jgi:oligopeptide/dipeptide ABC transporter ATP-binding protein|nr:peptide/nickel transport system ATP-binding protein [Clostridiales bacterium]
MSDAILEIKNLKTYFKTRKGLNPAVDGISFNIEAGKITALVGESGSGKSMTAMSILGLVPQPAGKIMPESEIWFEDQDLTKLSERTLAKIRGNEISMIFQEPMTSLNPVYTIGKQLMEPLRIHQKMSKADARALALKYLEMVRVPDPERRMSSYPHQLSGGLRQRVMIAMAMVCKPKVIIADEPTTALDVTIQAQILKLLKDVQEQLNTAILFITHDLGVVAELCDDVCVMYAGQIVEKATVEMLFENPSHPYTAGLLKSLPRVDDDVDMLYSIEGMVPNLINIPEGCRFASRCPKAMEKCREKEPPKVMIETGHEVHCWLYE